jgi:hypothetical protein
MFSSIHVFKQGVFMLVIGKDKGDFGGIKRNGIELNTGKTLKETWLSPSQQILGDKFTFD